MVCFTENGILVFPQFLILINILDSPYLTLTFYLNFLLDMPTGL